MTYKAFIDVMPRPELLDPQGKAVARSMKNLDLAEIAEVRIGKHIELQIDAESEELAREKVTAACEKLLSNPIVESFEFELKAI